MLGPPLPPRGPQRAVGKGAWAGGGLPVHTVGGGPALLTELLQLGSGTCIFASLRKMISGHRES